MKLSIYQKLFNACVNAKSVIKGDKVKGMHFNPLEHDEVQRVAMKALLAEKLYPVCSYTNEIKENCVMVTCHMKIHDAENPGVFIEINGCGGIAALDKFGTGNGMSYARKYAFLSALNLRTGQDSDDGYNAKLFSNTKSKEQSNDNNVVEQEEEDNIDYDALKEDLIEESNVERIKYLINSYGPLIKDLNRSKKNTQLYIKMQNALEVAANNFGLKLTTDNKVG